MKVNQVAKDDFQSGDDYAICETCGAHLRNYVKIGASTYGIDCAAKLLGIKKSRVGAHMTLLSSSLAKMDALIDYFSQADGTDWVDWDDFDDSHATWQKCNGVTYDVVQLSGIEDCYNFASCSGPKYLWTVAKMIGKI